MPGSWEIKQANQVLVGILHTEATTIAWSFGLRNLIVPGQILPVSGMPFDHGRNSIVQTALTNGFSHVFMLDSDVIPPRDTILRLMSHNLPVVSGVYCRRSPPHGVPVMLKGGQWITQLPASGLMEVDLVGAGCLLVHRSVFESIPHQRPGKPWFDWKVDQQGILPPEECLSEDFSWNRWIRKHGVKIFVDCSIRCRHIGYAEADFASMQPLNTLAVT